MMGLTFLDAGRETGCIGNGGTSSVAEASNCATKFLTDDFLALKPGRFMCALEWSLELDDCLRPVVPALVSDVADAKLDFRALSVCGGCSEPVVQIAP